MRALWLGMGAGALIAYGVALSPALGAQGKSLWAKPRVSLSARGGLGSFTPAATDPRLSAMLSRNGLTSSGFRFTPASTAVRLNRSVTVAVRARSSGGPLGGDRSALVSAPATNTTPTAYNLGVALGWRRFALSSDVVKVDLGTLGGREAVDVGVSYSAPKWSTRLAVGADRPTAGPRALAQGNGYSLDLAGSYSITRNVDLTAGLRYRAAERERLSAPDGRRDSQAVYIGTAFKF